LAVRITPEPAPEEQEALLRALSALDDAQDDVSAWWRAGVREAIEGEPEDEAG